MNPPGARALVWLFDIDGTLLLTQGAGRDALSLALRDQFGVEDDLSGIPFAGPIAAVRMGRGWFVPAYEVERLLLQQREAGGATPASARTTNADQSGASVGPP